MANVFKCPSFLEHKISSVPHVQFQSNIHIDLSCVNVTKRWEEQRLRVGYIIVVNVNKCANIVEMHE